MNQFQIHDKDGKAIVINDLDHEACDLWGTKIDNEPRGSYASPYDKPGVYDAYMRGEYKYSGIVGEVAFYASRANWFDYIGWKIAQGNTTWKGLKDALLEVYRKYEIPDEEVKKDPRIWGFIELIDHWESKGYVPVCLSGDDRILSKGGVKTQTEEEVRMEENMAVHIQSYQDECK